MGVVKSIRFNKFPKQSEWLGKEVGVMFHHDADHALKGTVVRDDMAPPGLMIIRLEDGRHVLSTECQYTPPD